MSNNVNTTRDTLLLELKDVKKHFPIRKGVFGRARGLVKAVDGITFYLEKGDSFGLVGESGCGKSTASKMILLIEKPTSGEIFFEGKNIFELSNLERQSYRESIQPVFQDPSGSLSPRLRIGDIIAEPIKVGGRYSKKEIKDRINDVLLAVGLREEHAQLFPHEFSGGQRQRIAIARALSTNPRLILLDEPISSLDVSIRAQVMNLLINLQKKLGLSYLFIAHDLAVVLHMSTNIGVMYAGKIMERASSDEIYQHPAHPYTKALFNAAFQHLKILKSEKAMLPGEVASPLNPPPGCRFHPRCPYAKGICSESEPKLKMVSDEHEVACHLFE